MVANIAVIGAGQLGSRHLQALALINRPISIEVVDSSTSSLDTARERFTQVLGRGFVKSVKYFDSIAKLSSKLDVVIVATTADSRRAVVEKVLNYKHVRYLILEKVVFQNPQDFIEIDKILNEKGVKAWVNCPRRMWPFYQQLKQKLKGAKNIEYLVSGANSHVGLGCNGIHFLDHYAFLTGEVNINLNVDRLDNEIHDSKRAGFIEFTGTIYGGSADGGIITISAYANNDAPVMVTILSDTMRCIIHEEESKAWLSEKECDWQWQQIEFTIPYQSQLTHIAIQNILDNNNCVLTSYHESWKLHEIFLKALKSHLSRCRMEEMESCPIT